MSVVFKDRQSTYPNRYKVTNESGESYYVTLERADEPTVAGTPLNAATLNAVVNHTHDAEALKIMFAAGNTVLSSNQYGSTLPSAGTPGRIFFKKVDE
jgi:hypothetical protein